jgi:hypothetical protein
MQACVGAGPLHAAGGSRLDTLMQSLKDSTTRHFHVTGNLLLRVQKDLLYVHAGCCQSFEQWVGCVEGLIGYGYRMVMHIIAATQLVNGLPDNAPVPQHESH